MLLFGGSWVTIVNSVSTQQSTDTPSETQFTILLVDDEPNILTSLRRLLRPVGYKLLTAESGAQAISLLQSEPVDLVISDMKMPVMTGAEFLEKVYKQWPDTVRILLTGYADIASTIDAINKGKIYRYISKPWEDQEVLLLVEQALEMKTLQKEKARLELLTLKQNEQLTDLNASLEAKVEERTKELNQANDKLKKSFITSVKVFASLIELREGNIAGHSRRVADVARSIAQKLGLSDVEVQDIFLASLLHDIGKIGLSDAVLKKPFESLTLQERELVMKHPVKGQSILMALEQLSTAATLIRHHHERFDGAGYPDKLSGLMIPIGARILAVANDYDALQCGTLSTHKYSKEEAIKSIQQLSGKRYDPTVAAALSAVTGVTEQMSHVNEREIVTSQLTPGMVLTRDLVSRDGALLLAKDYILEQRLINQILHFEQSEGRAITIFVQK